jgi:hypothetical protein
MRRWLADRRGDMMAGALTFSLTALVALALVSFASTTATPRSRLWHAGRLIGANGREQPRADRHAASPTSGVVRVDIG